ncbi:MAG: hypothetical protein NC320_01955 [Clostridium sp.]|nr:hypothetical protein [Clostridium sp.]
MNSDRSVSLANTFFSELKQYNSTNFKALHTAKLDVNDPGVIKAFSSVITRFFIFCEKHPELSDIDKRILYFQLKIDMIARFFAKYPDTNTDDLVAFQTELRYYVKESGDDNEQNAAPV